MYVPEFATALKDTLDADLFDIFEKQVGQVDDDHMLVLTLLRIQDTRSGKQSARGLDEIWTCLECVIEGDHYFHVRQK